MTTCCDICGKDLKNGERYHAACLRHLFGIARLPTVELRQGDVLAKAQEMAGKLSISGVQPKLSMSRQGSKLIPVTTGGQFILKPQTERFPDLPQNENLCMTIAQLMGINIPPHGLFDLQDGSPAYLVRRFDRTQDGHKLHCEDFTQILGEDDKYSGSLEQIGKRIQEMSRIPGLDVQLFFERALLNFLLGNGDAHLKNFSLLETDAGRLRLSPAYDIVCSKVVLAREMDSALTINGKQNGIARHDFERLGMVLKILPKVLDGIFERFDRGHPAILEQIRLSRLSGDMRDKVRRIITERHQRIFAR